MSITKQIWDTQTVFLENCVPPRALSVMLSVEDYTELKAEANGYMRSDRGLSTVDRIFDMKICIERDRAPGDIEVRRE